MTSLPDHLERYLGKVHSAWRVGGDSEGSPFQVIRHEPNDPHQRVWFSSLGISTHGLEAPGGKRIYSELLLCSCNTSILQKLPGIIEQVGIDVLKSHRPILRGEVLGPRGSLLGSKMEALYAAPPSYLPVDFAKFVEGPRRIALVWLIPITFREAQFIATLGWSSFEDLLVEFDLDLCDLNRPEVPLGGLV